MRPCLPQQALLMLIRALIISKVDYCCSVLVGVSGHLLDRLQSVLNGAVRLAFQRGVLNASRRSCAISTGCTHDLDRWLRVPLPLPGARVDTVCPLCSDVPLSQWHSSVLHRRQYLPARPPGIPVLKLKNSPTLSEKFPKFPVVYQA